MTNIRKKLAALVAVCVIAFSGIAVFGNAAPAQAWGYPATLQCLGDLAGKPSSTICIARQNEYGYDIFRNNGGSYEYLGNYTMYLGSGWSPNGAAVNLGSLSGQSVWFQSGGDILFGWIGTVMNSASVPIPASWTLARLNGVGLYFGVGQVLVRL